jgi:hypothetical protein
MDALAGGATMQAACLLAVEILCSLGCYHALAKATRFQSMLYSHVHVESYRLSPSRELEDGQVVVFEEQQGDASR